MERKHGFRCLRKCGSAPMCSCINIGVFPCLRCADPASGTVKRIIVKSRQAHVQEPVWYFLRSEHTRVTVRSVMMMTLT